MAWSRGFELMIRQEDHGSYLATLDEQNGNPVAAVTSPSAAGAVNALTEALLDALADERKTDA